MKYLIRKIIIIKIKKLRKELYLKLIKYKKMKNLIITIRKITKKMTISFSIITSMTIQTHT